MSRLDTLTDEKLDKALTLLWSAHAWLRGTPHESPRRFVGHAIAILEGTKAEDKPTKDTKGTDHG